MVNLGDRAVGSTLSFLFNTHKADGTPITLAGTPVISVYKNSTTQSTAGVTLTVDYDSRTGMHHVIIDLSADGTFYATENDFNVVITTGTVDSISVVGSVVGKFSIGRQNISHAASTAWASGAITAASIAADAIGSSEFSQAAADKVWSSATRSLTEFSTTLALSVWNVLTASITTANSFGKKLVDWLAGTDTSTPTVNATKVNGTSQTAGDVVALLNKLRETLYQESSVWIDTVSGSAGTTSYVNGTVLNPCSSIADAKTIADALGIHTFRIVDGTVTLVADMSTGYNFIGTHMSTLALGGQIITGCYFQNLYINGSASSSSGNSRFHHCVFNNNQMSLCATTDSYVEGTFRVLTTGAFELIDANSVLTLAPIVIDFNSPTVAASTILFTGFSGRMQVINMGAGDKLDVNGDGAVELAASCTGGTAAISGHIELTDNSAGTTVTDNTATTTDVLKWGGTPVTGDGDWAELQTDVDSVLTNIAALNDISVADILITPANKLATDANGRVDFSKVNGNAILHTLGNLKVINENGDKIPSVSEVNAEVDTALSDIKLDHLIAVAESGDVVNSSIIAKLASKSATPSFSSFDNTTDSLEAISDEGGASLTAQEVRDAMKLAPTAGVPAAGSVDEHLDTLIVDVANVDGNVLTVQSTVDIIDDKVDIIDTNVDDIETLLGTVNGNVNDIESKVDIIDTNVDDVETLLGTVSTNVNDIETLLGTVNGNVDDIEAKVDIIDTNVDAVLVDTTAIEVDTQDIQSRIPAALVSGMMNSNVDAIKDDADIPTLFNKAIIATEVGEVGAGTHTTTYLDTTTLTGLTVDAIKHRVINFTSGDNKGRSAPIIGYVSASGAITLDSNYPLPATPVNGDTFTVT